MKPAFNFATSGQSKVKSYYQGVYNDIATEQTLTDKQKQKFMAMLLNVAFNYELKQREKKKQEMEQARREEMERELSIYRDLLANRKYGSSILKDFHTLRY